jgi:hypothetical protein
MGRSDSNNVEDRTLSPRLSLVKELEIVMVVCFRRWEWVEYVQLKNWGLSD